MVEAAGSIPAESIKNNKARGDFTKLNVMFRNNKQQKIIGTMHLPNKEKEKKKTIILCHGFGATMNSYFFPQTATELMNQGYKVLLFDCAGAGLSEGEYHPTYKTMIEDLSAAVDYVKKNYEGEIIVGGHSMGGTAAIMVSTEKPEVAGLITFGAVAHPEQSVKRKKEELEQKKLLTDKGEYYEIKNKDRVIKLSKEFLTDAQEIKPVEAIARNKKPKIIFHALDDERINVEEARELFIRAGLPKRIKLLPKGGHKFINVEEELLKTLIEFLNETKKEK